MALPSEDIKKPEPEPPEEKTVTVKYPVYGPVYTVYWIKDDAGNVIYETTDASEWETVLSSPGSEIFYKAATYGSEGRQDITGYKEEVMTESDYYKSDFPGRQDVTVIPN